MGKQAGGIQKQSSAPPRSVITCRNRSTTPAGAGLQVEQLSLARLSIDTIGKSNHAFCLSRSSALRGSVRAGKLRMPVNTNSMSRRAGLSTKATATTRSSNPSAWQIGLRFAKWRAPRRANKGGDTAAGGSKRRLSFLPGGGGAGDTALVYGLVALNVAGTLVWSLDLGRWGHLMVQHLMVSTHSTLGQLKLHTLFTSSFSHSNMWNGALCSYMVYNFGASAIQILGRSQFLALYLLGGAFSQLCQVAGPIVATKLGLPTVLQVDQFYYSSGGSGSVLALLAWYCISFPASQVVLVVVPIQTGIAGALYLGATLFQVVTNGQGGVPFIGGPTDEIWRTLGAAAAGCFMAFASRGRGRGAPGRYSFIKRH